MIFLLIKGGNPTEFFSAFRVSLFPKGVGSGPPVPSLGPLLSI